MSGCGPLRLGKRRTQLRERAGRLLDATAGPARSASPTTATSTSATTARTGRTCSMRLDFFATTTPRSRRSRGTGRTSSNTGRTCRSERREVDPPAQGAHGLETAVPPTGKPARNSTQPSSRCRHAEWRWATSRVPLDGAAAPPRCRLLEATVGRRARARATGSRLSDACSTRSSMRSPLLELSDPRRSRSFGVYGRRECRAQAGRGVRRSPL
jgi:hypothetical protein